MGFIRFAPLAILAAVLLALPLSADPAPKSPPMPEKKAKPAPSKEEIDKAIRNLASNRFAVREQAQKLLWEAGSAAEPALKDAARSDDPDLANRAKSILDKFDWGLYPDTDPKVSEIIQSFQKGDPATRQNAVQQLLQFRPLPVRTLRKAIGHEEDGQAKKELFAKLAQHAREVIPELIYLDRIADVEELLELSLNSMVPESVVDYVTYVYVGGKVDAALAKFEKQVKGTGESADVAREVLVYLYRIKRDWAKSLSVAESLKREDLVEAVLWEQGNWKELNQRPIPAAQGGNDIGYRAALARLAGDRDKYEGIIAEIRKAQDGVESNMQDMRVLADALLLNDKAEEGIKLMIEKKFDLSAAFDMLCLQMKHKEAFKLIDDARRRDTEPGERTNLDIRRARMLYLLGDRDTALQLFTAQIQEIKQASDIETARLIVRTVARLGLKEKATEYAASSIDLLLKTGQRDGLRILFEPIWEKHSVSAEILWTALRGKYPKESAAETLARMTALFAGKASKELPEIEKLLNQGEAVRPVINRNLPIDEVETLQPGNGSRFFALAEIYRLHGDEGNFLKFARKAAENHHDNARIAMGDYFFNLKRYADAAEQYALEWNKNKTTYISALALYLQGRALIASGIKNKGEELIRKATLMSLGNEYSRGALVAELDKRDWHEAAQREADIVLQIGWYQNYYTGNVLSREASQAGKRGDFARVADCYERGMLSLMRTGVSYIEATSYLGVPEGVKTNRARAMLKEGKFDAALEIAKANLKLMPGNIETALLFIPELDRLKKNKEADALYQQSRNPIVKLAEDYPKSAYAHNSAAWLMANARRELDKAIGHAKKATELEPANAGYLDTLAEAHFRNGDKDKAIELMKKCIELDGAKKYFRKQLERFKTLGPDSVPPDENEEDDD